MILQFDGYLELPALGKSFQGHCAPSGPQLSHTEPPSPHLYRHFRPTALWICACPKEAILSISVNNLHSQGGRGKTTQVVFCPFLRTAEGSTSKYTS